VISDKLVRKKQGWYATGVILPHHTVAAQGFPFRVCLHILQTSYFSAQVDRVEFRVTRARRYQVIQFPSCHKGGNVPLKPKNLSQNTSSYQPVSEYPKEVRSLLLRRR
jgi:hypothetical protein